MTPTFIESQSGHPWDYHRDGDDFEYYEEQGACQLEIVVTDCGEHPTKEIPQKMHSDHEGKQNSSTERDSHE